MPKPTTKLIISSNIENVRTNRLYLEEIKKYAHIICIQEHWLPSYDSESINTNPNFLHTTKCYDDDNLVIPSHRPRGSAGISILWKKELDSAVKVLHDGSPRPQCIQIQTEATPIVLVSTYMPAEGSLDKSTSYDALLDEVYHVTQLYA